MKSIEDIDIEGAPPSRADLQAAARAWRCRAIVGVAVEASVVALFTVAVVWGGRGIATSTSTHDNAVISTLVALPVFLYWLVAGIAKLGPAPCSIEVPDSELLLLHTACRFCAVSDAYRLRVVATGRALTEAEATAMRRYQLRRYPLEAEEFNAADLRRQLTSSSRLAKSHTSGVDVGGSAGSSTFD